MPQSTKQDRPNSRVLARTDGRVKGKIVAAGIRLGELAHAVGLTSSALTLYVQGKCGNRARQEQIYVAFRALSQSDITLEEFWGELLSERMAG